MSVMMEEGVIFTGEDLAKGDVMGLLKRYLMKNLSQAATSIENKAIESEDEYAFKHKYRGMAVIICNESYAPYLRMEPRSYADQELSITHKTFSSLGFVVVRFKNLTALQMFEVLAAASSPSMDFFNKDADCFACVLASHGNEVMDANRGSQQVQYRQHVIYGTDAVVKTQELVDLFENSRCPSLREKPKLFFVQACRSIFGVRDQSRLDHGVDIPVQTSFATEVGPSATKNECKDCCRGERNVVSGQDEKRVAPTENSGNKNCTEHVTEKVCQINKSRDIDDSKELLGSKSDITEAVDVPFGHVVCLHSSQKCTQLSTDISEGLRRSLKKVILKIFSKKEKTEKEPEILNIASIPCHADTMILYSTTSGKSSFGRENAGGWMIFAFHKAVELYLSVRDSKLDLLKIITNAMGAIATQLTVTSAQGTKLKAAAAIEHRLTKDVIFRIKYE